MKKEKITHAIITNKELKFRLEEKENIEQTGDRYFDFNLETLKIIANKDISQLKRSEWFTIVQVLFPDKLICSGLFDSFVIFDVIDGKRIDPPKYCYSHIQAYLNNDNKSKVNRLIDEIKDLFLKNNIDWNKSWNKYFSGVINEL